MRWPIVLTIIIFFILVWNIPEGFRGGGGGHGGGGHGGGGHGGGGHGGGGIRYLGGGGGGGGGGWYGFPWFSWFPLYKCYLSDGYILCDYNSLSSYY